jgi:site-specific DNA-methyltransferase (adenine-specific)
MLRTFKGIERMLKKDGVAIVVIGDVANPGDAKALALAVTVWENLEGQTGLESMELIEDYLKPENKVSRIWGETKGEATNRDCALVLKRRGGDPFVSDGEISWEEPYKDIRTLGPTLQTVDFVRSAKRPDNLAPNRS